MRNTVPGWRPWRAWSFLFILPSVLRAEALSGKGWFSLAHSQSVNKDLVKTQCCDSAYDSVVYDQVKTRLSGSQAEVEVLSQLQSIEMYMVIGSSFRVCFQLWQSGFYWTVSDGIISTVRRKWKCPYSFDSNSVMHMTLLMTLIFDFHKVISTLTTPLTILLTLSIVKTSLKRPLSSRLQINLRKLTGAGTLTAIARPTAY